MEFALFLHSYPRSYSDAAATNSGVGEGKSEPRGKGKDKPNSVGCAVVGVETRWVFPVARFHGKIDGFSLAKYSDLANETFCGTVQASPLKGCIEQANGYRTERGADRQIGIAQSRGTRWNVRWYAS